MPKITARKLILIAGIAALALAAMPIRQAGSADALKQMHTRAFAPTTAAPMCRPVRLRICRSVRGRPSAYIAYTPVMAAAIRTGYGNFRSM